MKSNRVPGWTWLASVAVHGAVVGLFAWATLAHLRADEGPIAASPSPGAGPLIPIELPGFAEGTLLADRPPDPTGDPPAFAGGAEAPRLDTGHAGSGGDRTVDKPATHLADKDERLRLTPDLLSRLDRDQEQRLRTASQRVAWEDRRATRNPMELTFLASGVGAREERRTPSPFDPSRGALASPRPQVRGGDVGAAPDDAAPGGARESGDREGSLDTSPGLGVHDGRPGLVHQSAAAVRHARPDVVQGPPTIPAPAKGRPNDTVDSDQEVANAVRSLVHASTAGGVVGPDGRGGIGAGGDPGIGGAGTGSHPRPLGEGEADWLDFNTSDPRLVPYFRRLKARLQPLLAHAFPKSAILDLKQGTVILEVVIAADGSARVAWPPARPSGIDEFDKNAFDAVRGGAPFEPIPANLGRSSLRIRMPIDAQRDW